VFAAYNAQVFPIQIVRALFIAYPVAFGIPERPGIETDDRVTGARKPLQHDATAGADANNNAIDFLFAKVAHGNIDRLHGTKPVAAIAGLLQKFTPDVADRAAKREFQ